MAENSEKLEIYLEEREGLHLCGIRELGKESREKSVLCGIQNSKMGCRSFRLRFSSTYSIEIALV